jgi:hypothetical protein
MKKILIAVLIIAFTNVQAQYSTYYNVDVNANINKNVNVSGRIHEHKTITTIDYGALQLANAQNEKNRLENIKYEDEQQRLISLEVATDPVKAYDYGSQNTFTVKGKDAKSFGFRSFTMSYRIPHNALFVQAGKGRFENVSSDGITTEIIFSAPEYNKKKDTIDVENIAKLDGIIGGQLYNEGNNYEYYVHKKDIRKATIFGIQGFKTTLIWEDNYQYNISDYFNSYNPFDGNGVLYSVIVRTYGDKDNATFEELEGRRYYLKQLIEKVISTATVYDMTY